MTGTSAEYFEDMYEGDPDPWQFDTSWYEARKRDLLLAALPEERYRSGYEPGCANGALTERLALRCDHLLATDLIASVVDRARRRLAAHPHVEVRRQVLPAGWPDPDTLDLVVLSEIGYYFDAATLGVLSTTASLSLQPGGTLVAVHWRRATNYPLTASETHAALDAAPGLRNVATHREPDFLLDVWRKA